MSTDRRLCIVRHAARLDVLLRETRVHHDTWREATASAGRARMIAEGSEGSSQEDFVRKADQARQQILQKIPWDDREHRPYDTPIIDAALAVEAGTQLMGSGVLLDCPADGCSCDRVASSTKICGRTVIVSSPFRRALQTAGHVARVLGCTEVHVHLGLGEMMDRVREECGPDRTLLEHRGGTTDTTVDLPKSSGTRATPAQQTGLPFTYLSRDSMQEHLGQGVTLGKILGEQPHIMENAPQARIRYARVLASLAGMPYPYAQDNGCAATVAAAAAASAAADVATGEAAAPGTSDALFENASHVVAVAHGETLASASDALCGRLLTEAAYCSWMALALPQQVASHATTAKANDGFTHVVAAEGVRIMPATPRPHI